MYVNTLFPVGFVQAWYRCSVQSQIPDEYWYPVYMYIDMMNK